MQLCGLTLEEVWGDATLLVLYSDDTVFDSLLVELELWPLESLHIILNPVPLSHFIDLLSDVSVSGTD